MLLSDLPGSETASPLLSVTGLEVSYGTAAVLTGADFHVDRGEMVGLAGRNGAGKTTLLRSLSGLIGRGKGSVTWQGGALPREPERVLRCGIAHVPEGRRVFRSLSVEENLQAAAFGARQQYRAEDRDRVLALFPALEALLGRKAGFLSGGEQQMVAISRGLVARPSLLLIDELSLGLAPLLVGEMWQALSSLRGAEMAFLLVDQNVRTLAAHCDRIYLLDDGKTVEAGSGGQREDQLRALYFD